MHMTGHWSTFNAVPKGEWLMDVEFAVTENPAPVVLQQVHDAVTGYRKAIKKRNPPTIIFRKQV